MRTLIVRPGAIGDSLLTFPIINILREQDTNPYVTLVSNPAILPLAQAFGLAEEVDDYGHPQWGELFSPAGISSPALRNLLRQTDRVICVLTDKDGIVQQNLHRAGVASVIVTSSHPAQEKQHLHRVVYLAETLGLPPIDVTAPFEPPMRLATQPRLRSPNGPTAGAMNCAPTFSEHRPSIATASVGAQFIAPAVGPTGAIAIHPGSGGANKCWPITHFMTLIDTLCSRGFPVLLPGGPADHERIAALLDALAPRYGRCPQGKPLRTLLDAPLLDVAYHLQQCRWYIGNDSGLTHLSALLGIPTVAIFGPSDPANWRPLGPTVKVIRAQPLEQLAVETVMGIMETAGSFSIDRYRSI